MPLDRVPGKPLGALVDHANGGRGCSCLRGPPRHHPLPWFGPQQGRGAAVAFFILDRLELPSGAKVGLWHFVGFKLRLAPGMTLPPPREDIIVERARIESGRQRGEVEVSGGPRLTKARAQAW
jgi:hypothetical protein